MFKTENKTTKISNYGTVAPSCLKVLYDGNCVMCLAMVRHFSKLSSAAEVEWKPVFPTTATERSELRFQIIDNKGSEFFDTDARLLLLKAYPRYRVLGSLLSNQYLRWIINPVFSLIAANRYRISNVLAYLGLAKRNNAIDASACDGNCQCMNHKER